MFRMERARCIALALLVAVSLLLPLPAAAGGLGKQQATHGWEGVWTGLLGWLGLLPHATPPGLVTEEDSSSIDPNGRPHVTTPGDDSSFIDPNG